MLASVSDQRVLQGSHVELGLSDQEAVELYRLMLVTRSLDERIWALNRQGKIGITAPCRGQEATQVGAGRAFQPGVDVFLPYYRDLGLLVALGYSPRELMLDATGRAAGPFSAGRQMPFHWTSRRLRILSPSSSVGTQLPHAVGAALACQLRGEQAVTLVTFGDGATSKGDFHEALNIAGVWKLPVVFLCENNQYAISLRAEKQMAVAHVADRALGYNIPGFSVDGNDVLAVYGAAARARAIALRERVPVLLECLTYRLMPHTSNDDDSNYRAAEEVERWRGRDPVTRYRAYLCSAGLLGERAAVGLAERVDAGVLEATREALESPEPTAESALDNLFAPGTLNVPRLSAAHAIPREQVEALRAEIGA